MNGPQKIESLSKFYPSFRISQNFLMGLRVSDFVSVSHIYAFLLSHYTFSPQAQILRCQSQRVIYHSPPIHVYNYIIHVCTQCKHALSSVCEFMWLNACRPANSLSFGRKSVSQYIPVSNDFVIMQFNNTHMDPQQRKPSLESLFPEAFPALSPISL